MIQQLIMIQRPVVMTDQVIISHRRTNEDIEKNDIIRIQKTQRKRIRNSLIKQFLSEIKVSFVYFFILIKFVKTSIKIFIFHSKIVFPKR